MSLASSPSADEHAIPYQSGAERGTYTRQVARRQTFRQDHGASSPVPVEADTTFNWGVRRGDLLLVSGDFPRFAFLTRRRETRNNPPPLKFGDGRLELVTGRGLFRWEDATSITATFTPTGTEHAVRWADLPGVIGTMRVGLTGPETAAVLISIRTEAGASFSGSLSLDFGGVATHGRTFSGAYFPPGADDDPRSTITVHDNGGTLSCPDYPERMAFRFADQPKLNASGGRIRVQWPISLDATDSFTVGSTWQLLAGTVEPAVPVPFGAATALAKMAEESRAFLAKAAVSLPAHDDIGRGFDAAVLTLESCWDRVAWLESIHWWSCYWTNNYQISAAIALGQWDRARRALEFFLSDDARCPARLADGSPMDNGEGMMGYYDALPFWLHQLASYVDATGDREIVRQRYRTVEETIDTLLAARREPGGLFNWFLGANSTVYQADHLGWPGQATSPSFLVAHALRDWGRLCQEIGESKAGQSWIEMADEIEQLARTRLWDEARGCFVSHRDERDHTFPGHYYSDHVYPALYGNILSSAETASVLENLRQELTFETPTGRLLMRVGNYQPPIFANSNVMPTQMAEAAMAFQRLGENETAARFLAAVGVSATLDTESPGSFPERLLDNGKGEANYGFGNPSGAYAMAVINGLFGVSLKEGGEACEWQPAFPGTWPSASLHLPWVDLDYARAGAEAAEEIRTYVYASAQPRRLRFRVLLPVADTYRVIVDDQKTIPTLEAGLDGVWLSLPDRSTQKTSIQISFIPQLIRAAGPEVVASGAVASWQLPAGPVTVDDPGNALGSLRLENGKLTGIPRSSPPESERQATVYARLSSPATIVPIAFRVVPPVALIGADLVGKDVLSDSASAHLQLTLRPGPGDYSRGRLTVDVGAHHAVMEWRGEREVSLPVPPPRSGQKLAAIPLALRLRLESPDGSIWMDRAEVIMPRGHDAADESALRDGRAVQAQPVPFDKLPLSSTLHMTFPWRYRPSFDLKLRDHAQTGFVSDGERFSVPADQDAFCLVDGGRSHLNHRLPVPSEVPKSLAIPVKRRAGAVSLLFASEMEMRLHAAQVGEIRLHYSTGADDFVPLVANTNFDSLRGHSAPHCSPVSLNDQGDYLNLLRLPCDATRELDYITVTMQERDARLALVGLHIYPGPSFD